MNPNFIFVKVQLSIAINPPGQNNGSDLILLHIAVDTKIDKNKVYRSKTFDSCYGKTDISNYCRPYVMKSYS